MFGEESVNVEIFLSGSARVKWLEIRIENVRQKIGKWCLHNEA